MVAPGAPPVKTLDIRGHEAPIAAWPRAIARAREPGIHVHRVGDEWQASSASKSGQHYTVNGRCECRGAEHGYVCQHESAVRSAQLRAGELRRCENSGHVGAEARTYTLSQGDHGLVERV